MPYGILLLLVLGTLTDTDPLLTENSNLREELDALKRQLDSQKWGVNKIEGNDVKTRYYTGLPSFAIFLWLFKYV
jgi:hypothetical protein